MILALCGKRKSGKDTLAQFLIRNTTELFGEKFTVKRYAFADYLKEICINLLDLPRDKVYGTDEDKDTLTELYWSDLPHFCELQRKDVEAFTQGNVSVEVFNAWHSKMSIRQILQHIGSEFFRRMNPSCWTNYLLRTIKDESPNLAVITDCRFPSEADAVKDFGGKVIRLTRSLRQDAHQSEIAMNDYQKFDAVIDNQKQILSQTEFNLIEVLRGWGWING